MRKNGRNDGTLYRFFSFDKIGETHKEKLLVNKVTVSVFNIVKS